MPEPVRVLTLSHDLPFGGDETRVLSFARTVYSTQIHLSVATVNVPGLQGDQIRRHYEAAGVTVLTLGKTYAPPAPPSVLGSRNRALRTTVGAVDAVRMMRRLASLVREEGIDVIDARLEYAGLLAVPVAKLLGRKVAVTSYYLKSFNRSPFGWIAGQLVWGFADAVISDSQALVDAITSWTRIRRPRVLLIPNGIYRPENGTTQARARAILGLPSDDGALVIGQVSKLVETKGHLVLLEAAQTILRSYPDTWFVFVGHAKDPSYLERLNKRAADLGVAARLRIVSYSGDIADVWPAIDIHAHASSFDSLPIAIEEGMSLSKPAVVTNVGGVTEAVSDGETGLVVPVGDAVALADALTRLIKDTTLRDRLGAAAGRRYLERYQPELMARRLSDLFWELTGRGPDVSEPGSCIERP